MLYSGNTIGGLAPEEEEMSRGAALLALNVLSVLVFIGFLISKFVRAYAGSEHGLRRSAEVRTAFLGKFPRNFIQSGEQYRLIR